jgi:ribosomal protein S18 acetylase RimI-like enzyme
VGQLKQEADLEHIPLRLSVEKDNPGAQRFYKRLGFVTRAEEEEEHHLEYRPPGSDTPT